MTFHDLVGWYLNDGLPRPIYKAMQSRVGRIGHDRS
jgi:hypothetical protein